MKNIILLLLTSVIIYSCKSNSKIEDPKELIKNYWITVQNKDTSKFKVFYLTKDQTIDLIKSSSMDEKQKENALKSVDPRWDNPFNFETKYSNLLHNLKEASFNDFNQIKIDSIGSKSFTINGFELTNVFVYAHNDTFNTTIIFPTVQYDGGWYLLPLKAITVRSSLTDKFNEEVKQLVASTEEKYGKKDQQESPTWVNDRDDYPEGKYVITAEKTYFYNDSEGTTLRKTYLVEGDTVTLKNHEGGYGYVKYLSKSGKVTEGYINLVDIQFVE